MFTQCPKCESVFKVSEKDAQAHEGLVRCGNCFSVFNASWNLTDDPRNEFYTAAAVPHSSSGAANPVGSGFTFSLVNSQISQPGDISKEQPDTTALTGAEDAPEGKDDTAALPVLEEDELDEFPDPDMGDFPDAAEDIGSKATEKEEDEADLVYFANGDEEGEGENKQQVVGSSGSKDASLVNESVENDGIPLLTHPEDDDQSLSDADMWPGSELLEEDAEDGVDMPPLNMTGDGNTGMLSSSDEEESTDSIIHEKPPSMTDMESTSEMVHLTQPIEVLTREQEEAWGLPSVGRKKWTAIEDSLPETEEPAAPSDAEMSSASVEASMGADDAATEDMFSIDGIDDIDNATEDEDTVFSALEEETDEFTRVEKELDEQPGGESVFITADDEGAGDAYASFKMPVKAHEGSIQDLDDFPDPGELTELNMEDTMQIDAMLEAASISKEQLDSAMSEATIIDDESTGEESSRDSIDNIESITLESDDSFSTEIYDMDSSEEVGDANESEGDGPVSGKSGKAFSSRLKGLLPVGIGRKRAIHEPSLLDNEETQLIQSLSKSSGIDIPDWLKNTSMYTAAVILVVLLLGQVGYFYMDRLVKVSSLKPLLETGCQLAGCKVPAVQNLQEVEQLSSRLERGSDGELKISSILVNRDIRAQAFPALELTLTDRSGNIISRQVVDRNNYLHDDDAGPLLEPNEPVDINIRFKTPSIRVDGFELRPVAINWLERS
jgi:predicted Zn finger-like uncharacterized protein